MYVATTVAVHKEAWLVDVEPSVVDVDVESSVLDCWVVFSGSRDGLTDGSSFLGHLLMLRPRMRTQNFGVLISMLGGGKDGRQEKQTTGGPLDGMMTGTSTSATVLGTWEADQAYIPGTRVG